MGIVKWMPSSMLGLKIMNLSTCFTELHLTMLAISFFASNRNYRTAITMIINAESRTRS